MSWKYRADEVTVLHGVGIPSSSQEGPTLYIDRGTGKTYLNQGGGTTWNVALNSGYETLVTTEALTVHDSGTVFFLNLAGGFTATLPATASSAGVRYTFIVKTAPTTAYIIASAGGSSGDDIIGYLVASTGGDESSNGNAAGDQINFVANVALPGDMVMLFCDGAKWYATCICKATGAITITG